MDLARLIALAVFIAAAPVVLAQTDDRQTPCEERIAAVASLIPDLSENPDAPEQLGLTREQLQAALAALDAARLVSYDSNKCHTMVDAAKAMLEKGK